MLSKTVGQDALALILDGESFTSEEISNELRAAFAGSGIKKWRCSNADIFTYGGHTLVLAYPVPPLRERISEIAVRLVRA